MPHKRSVLEVGVHEQASAIGDDSVKVEMEAASAVGIGGDAQEKHELEVDAEALE